MYNYHLINLIYQYGCVCFYSFPIILAIPFDIDVNIYWNLEIDLDNLIVD